jgi:hypothetical protein
MKIDVATEPLPRPRALLVAAALIAVTTTYIAMRMPAAVRNFQAMFKELGITPISSTQLVFRIPDIWWLFALASIASLVWIATRSRVTAAEKRNMKTAMIVTVTLTALMYGFAAFAIYTPLFKIGATV